MSVSGRRGVWIGIGVVALALGGLVSEPWSHDRRRTPTRAVGGSPSSRALPPPGRANGDRLHSRGRYKRSRRMEVARSNLPVRRREPKARLACEKAPIRSHSAFSTCALRYIEATPRRSSLVVVFDQRSAFEMSLKRHGTRWLVDWFDIPWGPPSATCPGQAFASSNVQLEPVVRLLEAVVETELLRAVREQQPLRT